MILLRSVKRVTHQCLLDVEGDFLESCAYDEPVPVRGLRSPRWGRRTPVQDRSCGNERQGRKEVGGASAGLWGARRWGRTWAEACVPACCRTPGAAGRCSAWLGAGHGGRRRVCRHVRLVLAGALRHAPRPKLRRGRPRLGPRPVLCSRDQEARRPLPHLVPCPHWAAHSANVYGRQGRAWAGSGPRRHKPSSWP